jgi:hypothetical protein
MESGGSGAGYGCQEADTKSKDAPVKCCGLEGGIVELSDVERLTEKFPTTRRRRDAGKRLGSAVLGLAKVIRLTSNQDHFLAVLEA